MHANVVWSIINQTSLSLSRSALPGARFSVLLLIINAYEYILKCAGIFVSTFSNRITHVQNEPFLPLLFIVLMWRVCSPFLSMFDSPSLCMYAPCTLYSLSMFATLQTLYIVKYNVSWFYWYHNNDLPICAWDFVWPSKYE